MVLQWAIDLWCLIIVKMWAQSTVTCIGILVT